MPDRSEVAPPREAVAAHFPYGQYGWRLGRAAHSLAGGIAADQVSFAKGHQRYWTKVDYRAFTSALLVEGHSRRLRMSPDVPFDRRQPIADQLQELLATFREALPYSEAERRWLVDTESQFKTRMVLLDPDERGWRRPVPAPVKEQLIDLNAAEGEIASAGVRQVVQGRELTRRWWAWRRQTEEFTDEGSREIAYEALRGLGHMLVPNRAEAEQAGIPPVYMPPNRIGPLIPAPPTVCVGLR